MLSGETLLLVLQRLGYCAFLLDESGHVTAGNALGAVLLKHEAVGNEEIFRPPHEGNGALRQLLGQPTRPAAMPRRPWIVQDGTRRLLCSFEQPAGAESSSPHVLVIIDLEERQRPKGTTLQELFALTNAEAKLALQLAKGGTLEACAEENGTSVNTARVQLRSIFAKTGTARQSDLVAFLNRVAMLG